MASRLTNIREERIKKLEELKKLEINPYPSEITLDGKLISINSARAKHDADVLVAGRVMGMRGHGAILFGDLKDESGLIQLLFSEDKLKEKYQILKMVDTGDFIAVVGTVMKTQAGEITVEVKDFQILTKSIRPLPSEWYGLKDEEERYRQRYVDLILNDNLKDLFRKKALFWQSMRNFLIEKGFLEVETPVLENTAGGADANPFVTHHNALDIDLYLRISMGELWQKRLMVAGFEKTFEIGRQFRNEGMDREHLQDYSQMEFYLAYANYEDSMELVEELYKFVAKATFGTTKFKIGEHDVDLGKKWQEIDYALTIKEKHGIDITKASDEDLKKKLKELKVSFEKDDERGRLIDLIWKQVRKNISGPVFLTGHPVEVSPLAKRMEDRNEFVERYQVILAGSEMGNGYSELNDPIDQSERFKKQQEMREKGDEEAQMQDDDFVRALEYGMPPITGFGVSERLFSFLANLPVREAVLFPLLRPEGDSTKKKVKVFSKQNFTDYMISDEVKNKFPDAFFAYTIIRGVKIQKSDDELEKLKKETVEKRKSLTVEQISEIEPIKVYRKMFRETGVDLGSRKPSPEAMLRRIIQGKSLYNINTAVDAYNVTVIETGVGLGGFNFKKIAEPVVLRFSEKGEEMHLLGDEITTKTDEGELVYSDKEKLLTLDLNYRDINKTKITDDTTDIILFADGGPGLGTETVTSALEKGANYIMRFCGGKMDEIKVIQ